MINGPVTAIRHNTARPRPGFLKCAMVGAFAMLLGIAIPADNAAAAPVTVPVDLAPGQQYRLAFITSGTYNGGAFQPDPLTFYLETPDFVEDHVNSQPGLAALGSFWEVIASFDTSLYARDLTNTDPTVDGAGVPIYLLDGTTRIADDYADLWDGALAAPIHIREDGTPLDDGVHHIFTGTDSAGNVTPSFQLGQSGLVTAGRIIVGNPNWPFSFNNVTWVEATTIDASESHHYYGLSGLLMVPQAFALPAPGAALIIVFGVTGLALNWRLKVVRSRA